MGLSQTTVCVFMVMKEHVWLTDVFLMVFNNHGGPWHRGRFIRTHTRYLLGFNSFPTEHCETTNQKYQKSSITKCFGRLYSSGPLHVGQLEVGEQKKPKLSLLLILFSRNIFVLLEIRAVVWCCAHLSKTTTLLLWDAKTSNQNHKELLTH